METTRIDEWPKGMLYGVATLSTLCALIHLWVMLREAYSGLEGVDELFYREAGLRDEAAQSTGFHLFS
jgi:hypothetical protein